MGPDAPRPRAPFPLSFAQERFWLLDRLNSGATYVVPAALRLRGPLDPARLERALEEVVRRHAALRARFTAAPGGGAEQWVDDEAHVPLPLESLEAIPEAARDEELGRRLEDDAARGFDLERGPLLRARLFRLGPDHHVLSVALHHIATDGWSMDLLFRELGALYQALASEGAPALAPLPLQYGHFARWQRARFRGEAGERELAYWQEHLAGAPLLDLPLDRPRPAVRRGRGATHRFALPPALLDALGRVALQEDATPYVALMAAFHVVLARWSGEGDVVIGTPVAGRVRAELEGMVGLFMNTLAVRAGSADDPDFRTLLRRMRAAVMGALAHQELPFDRLVEALRPERAANRTPLFSASFSFQNTPREAAAVAGLTAERVRVEQRTAHNDLALEVDRDDGRWHAALHYDADLFDAATIEAVAARLLAVMAAVAADPDRRVSRIPLLDADERRALLAWGDAPAAPPLEPVHVRVAAWARRDPARVAARWAGGSVSYGELDARARGVTAVLRSAGVGPGAVVGVHAERSPALLAAVLGVLRAGAAYLPLDAAWPSERLAWVARDAGATTVVAQRALAERISLPGVRVLSVDDVPPAPDGADVPDAGSGDDAAYLIYTSGTTGRPKGVVVSHANLVHTLAARRAWFGAPPERFLLIAPFAFDAAVMGIFWTLGEGGTLVLAPEGAERDPARLAAIAAAERVTHLIALPALYELLLAEHEARPGALAALACACVAGEAPGRPLLARHRRALPDVPLHNEYGPTETTIWCTAWTADDDDGAPVPIGGPVAGVRAYVLDAHGELVPAGTPGELHVGGGGVARGYAGRPGLTAERFVPDPFSPVAGARMYRTGDRARWLPSGRLEFLGRIDRQVKVRGFRVEPGEVEAVLAMHPAVRQAAVVARADAGGHTALAAYWVPAPGAAAGARELRDFLGERLPPYMVPDAWVPLDAFPLTATGKVDRRALPDPAAVAAPAAPPQAPRGRIETAVAEVWRQVLGREEVGVTEHFFELGGNSLLLARVAERLRAEIGYEGSVLELLRYPTIRALAESLGPAAPEPEAVADPDAPPAPDADPERGAIGRRRAAALQTRRPRG